RNRFLCHIKPVLKSPLQHGKAGNQPCRPYAQQQEQRERTKSTQISLPSLMIADPLRGRRPQPPSETIEKSSEPKPTRDAAWQDDHLKRIPQCHGRYQETKNRDYISQRQHSSFLDRLALIPAELCADSARITPRNEDKVEGR